MSELSVAERWLPVAGWEGLYQVSDLGRVRSLDRMVRCRGGKTRIHRGVVLRQIQDGCGRRIVHLEQASRGQRTVRVHHLVLSAFVGPRPPDTEGCHNDGDSANVRVSNLRWDSHSENMFDQVRHGTHYETTREGCPLEHLLVHPNLVASKALLGHRNCLACARARAAKQRTELRGDCFDFRSDADRRYRQIMNLPPCQAERPSATQAPPGAA